MKEVRYDGKRRVKLPCLGSVKLACTLPRGICYEASIRRENGRWYICLKLWKPPEHKPERADRPGGIDTGINPLGTDSDGQTYRNPKASYQVERKLRRWQRAQARRHRHGHQPLGHRLRRADLPESQSLLPGGAEAAEMAAGPGAEAEGLPGLVGGPA